ncbi:MAG: CoA-binding protein [Bacteroidia bacterium]
MKSTLVLGASDNPNRYSYLAVNRLIQHGHPVHGFAKKATEVSGVPVRNKKEEIDIPNLDTISVYLSPENQREYYEWILELAPKRVIFNPGAENPELEQILRNHHIEPVEACTLVLLSIGMY